MSEEEKFYAYVLVDPRKPGKYTYGDYTFDYCAFYVGKGIGKRIKFHLIEAYNEYDLKYGYRSYKCNKIRKIKKESGKDPLAIKVKCNISESKAFELEKDLIKLIGRIKNGGILVNYTDGGDGSSGYIPTEETLQKLKDSHRGSKHHNYGKHLPEKTRRRISDSHKGKKHHYYGKHLSEEHRTKLSFNSGKNKSISINSIKFISVSEASKHLNIPLSTICVRLKAGKEGYEYLKKEHKIGIVKKYKYQVIDPLRNSYMVKKLLSFCRENNLSYSSMQRVLNGIQRTHKGWIVKRI